MWLSTSTTLGILAAHLLGNAFVNYHAPTSYMDEPFHVPMTQRYCNGDFGYWDPKITTFPGLYVLGSGYAGAAAAAFSWLAPSKDAFCSGPFLRSLNAFLSTACYQLAYGVYGLTHSNPTQQQPAPGAWAAAAIASLPTHLFFAFLYYTDVAALLFLLLTQYLLLQHRPHWAAAAGAAAIGMRQTNAVWVTFLVGASMLRDLGVGAATGTASSSRSTSKAASAAAGTASGPRQKHGVKPGHRQQHNDSWRRTFAGGCFQELGAALQQLAVRWPQLLRDYCSCLLLPAAFAGFVVWNKGITLGDREAHAPVSHVMQPLYFAAFAVAAAGPLLLSPGVVAAVQRRAQQQPWVSTAAAVASAAMVCTYCVQQYSLAHPYLLADNRHYTFYLWKRLLRKQAVRQGLVPLYVIGWALLMEGLASTQGHLWAVAYAAATAITLAPAWLLEFRYFTPPLVLALLHMPPPYRWAAQLTTAAYVGVTAALLYVFACRPFTWADGSVARFMW